MKLRRALIFAIAFHFVLLLLLVRKWHPPSLSTFVETDVSLHEGNPGATTPTSAEAHASATASSHPSHPTANETHSPSATQVGDSEPLPAAPSPTGAAIPTPPGGVGSGTVASAGADQAGANQEGKAGTPQGNSIDLSSYIAIANARIRAHKHYPDLAERRGLQGTVTVRFVIDAAGAVSSATITRSADPLLDDAALEAVKEAAPFPQALAGTREVNLDFHLNEH